MEAKKPAVFSQGISHFLTCPVTAQGRISCTLPYSYYILKNKCTVYCTLSCIVAFSSGAIIAMKLSSYQRPTNLHLYKREPACLDRRF